MAKVKGLTVHDGTEAEVHGGDDEQAGVPIVAASAADDHGRTQTGTQDASSAAASGADDHGRTEVEAHGGNDDLSIASSELRNGTATDAHDLGDDHGGTQTETHRGRDGHRGDMVWQNSNGTASVWTMTGGQVGGHLDYANPGSSWHLLGTGDLNGDGRRDLLWQNDDGTPSGWLVDPTNGSVAGYPVFSNPGSDWRLVGGADLDGNGRDDLVWQNHRTGAVSAWMTASGGTGIEAYVNFANPGRDWRLVGTGDLNGDGRSDLVWQHQGGSVSAWLMGGSLGAPSVSAYANFDNPGSDWRLVGTGDLNGDGRDDLLWQNRNGLPSAWLVGQDGTSVVGFPTFHNPGADWRLVGAGDANGDGRADLKWQSASGAPSLWLMGAGGTWVESYPTFDNPGTDWKAV